MSAIVGNGVEFVELILAKAFGAETGHAKTKAGDGHNDECREHEDLAICEDTRSCKELRSQTSSDDGISVCRQVVQSAQG